MNLEQIDKAKAISGIFAAIAVPIVIAIVGWGIQAAIAENSLKKDYIQIAATILQAPSNEENKALRIWAVSVIELNSPVRFSSDAAKGLSTGLVPERPIPKAPPAALNSVPESGYFVKAWRTLLESNKSRDELEREVKLLILKTEEAAATARAAQAFIRENGMAPP